MRVQSNIVIAALAAFLLATSARADVTLPAVIGDRMVLQRETEAPIWGWASPGESVRVEGSWGASAETVTDERGRWRVTLRTPAAGGPFTVRVAGRTTITLQDVLCGEVWICSGQSNMEWPLAQSQDGEREIASADLPRIRLFTVPNTIAAAPRIDGGGAWALCTPETAQGFSAVGYHFGRELHERLGVPIGLVAADWGGTPAEAWTRAGGLAPFPAHAAGLERLEALRDPARRMAYGRAALEKWWSDLDGAAPGAAAWRTALEVREEDGWRTMTLPAPLSASGLGGHDGVVWFRRVVEVPAPWAGQPAALALGPIDDQDDAWVNGVHVGATHGDGRWNEPRQYAIPVEVLRAGANVVAVRVLDTGGQGGFAPGAAMSIASSVDRRPLDLAGAWHGAPGPTMAQIPPAPQGAEIGPNAPSVLFNGMISPIVPYAIRGAIWYQGESNRGRAIEYDALFPATIASWRGAWRAENAAQGDFPFLFVQIAPFLYGGDRGEAARLRESQRRASLVVPSTAMAVTLDVGDPADIHPRNKREVGHRLALLARRDVYGERDLVASGPRLRAVEVEPGAMRLRFDDAGAGLVLRDDGRTHFTVAGDDRRFRTARAEIDGDALVVSSLEVPAPKAVRYAWQAAPAAVLFNREGLPASPFRTDDWEDAPPPANDAEMEAWRSTENGFIDLFNGRDLGGWRIVNGAPTTWTARDGVIACSGFPTGVLRTERPYEDFILELEWRHLAPQGNAGLFVWSDPLPARGQPFTRAIEVQVMDGAEGEWFTSDGDIFPIHGAAMTPENSRGGARAFPTSRRANPAPLWNHYRVVALQGEITLAVNGEVVTRGRACRPRKGYICLEAEGSPVEFRRIRIAELPMRGSGAPPEESAAVAESFTTLYTGIDFAGWQHGPDHAGHWRAEDWRLTFDGAGPDLWTERSYRDFVLMCDWRWTAPPAPAARPVIAASGDEQTDAAGAAVTMVVPDAGDSGIYLRGSSKSQVNIWCWPVGSGEVYGYRTDREMPADVRAAVTPREAADAPIGQWNRFVITMKGDRLTVVLNGHTVIENAKLPGVPAEGPIALQSHGSPIEFANLFIRALD